MIQWKGKIKKQIPFHPEAEDKGFSVIIKTTNRHADYPIIFSLLSL